MSGDDGNEVTIDREPPAETFELLGDEIRVGILEVLGGNPDEPVSFSELRKRAGVDDSGQFNYHLKKLQGPFVRKVSGGYKLTHAGRQIVGAIYAGTYTADARLEPVSTGFECPACETALRATYEDETARIDCECEETVEFFFPPGSVEQFDREKMPTAFYRWNYQQFQRVLAGFCPVCDGRMDAELVLDGDTQRTTSLPDGAAFGTAHFEFGCQRCGHTRTSLASSPAMVHPAVGGFLADHGFDVRLDPIWWIRDGLDSQHVTVQSTEPPVLAVEFTCDGETIVTETDENATVEVLDR